MGVIVHRLEREFFNSGDSHLCKPTYIPTFDWDRFEIQWGVDGVVMTKNGPYETAFFEAFFIWKENALCGPREFVRGEGETVFDAEIDCRNNFIFMMWAHNAKVKNEKEREMLTELISNTFIPKTFRTMFKWYLEWKQKQINSGS